MKKCKVCNEVKNKSEFYKQPSYKDGLDNKCKRCRYEVHLKRKDYYKEYHREYQKANREHINLLNKKRKYLKYIESKKDPINLTIKDITKDYLLHNMHKSYRELAEEFNCSTTTIRNYYIKHNINKIDARRKSKTPTKNYLLNNQHKSCKEIAKEFNCADKTIKRLYKKYGINKTPSRAINNIPSKEYLLENIGKTYKAIAEEFNCSVTTIKRIYKILGIRKNNVKSN